MPAVLLRGTRHSEKTSSSADSAVPVVGHELQLAPARHNRGVQSPARAGRSAALTVCSVACPLIKRTLAKARTRLPSSSAATPRRCWSVPIANRLFLFKMRARDTKHCKFLSCGDSMTDEISSCHMCGRGTIARRQGKALPSRFCSDRCRATCDDRLFRAPIRFMTAG